MRNFLAAPFAPYNGALVSKAFSFCGQNGTMIPITVNWNSYSVGGAALGTAIPNFNVNFSMNALGAGNIPNGWTLQSIYIDNLGVAFPVYVFFPDTLQTVACAPNSAGWFRVYTNEKSGIISARGMTDQTVNVSTQLFFTDVTMTPFIDYELSQSISLFKASPDISFFNGFLQSDGYDAAALGDQVYVNQFPLVAQGQSLLLPAKASGQWRVTNFSCVVAGPSQAGNGINDLSFQRNTPGTTYFSGSFAWSGTTQSDTITVMSIQGCQLKLDATVPYFMTHTGVILGQGVAKTNIVVSWLPNG